MADNLLGGLRTLPNGSLLVISKYYVVWTDFVQFEVCRMVRFLESKICAFLFTQNFSFLNAEYLGSSHFGSNDYVVEFFRNMRTSGISMN